MGFAIAATRCVPEKADRATALDDALDARARGQAGHAQGACAAIAGYRAVARGLTALRRAGREARRARLAASSCLRQVPDAAQVARLARAGMGELGAAIRAEAADRRAAVVLEALLLASESGVRLPHEKSAPSATSHDARALDPMLTGAR